MGGAPGTAGGGQLSDKEALAFKNAACLLPDFNEPAPREVPVSNSKVTVGSSKIWVAVGPVVKHPKVDAPLRRLHDAHQAIG